MSRNTLFLASLAAFFATAIAVPASPSPSETRALYLLNCLEFVEWPTAAFADSQSPVVIGVIGKDPFGAELDKLQQKTVNGRKLQIKRFKGALEFRGEETPGRRQDALSLKQARKTSELKTCHILFISASEENYIPLILKPLRSCSVLTMSDSNGFAREGGVIRFLDEGNRVRLEINLDAADRAGLKISSKLLSLAKVVKNGRPADGK